MVLRKEFRSLIFISCCPSLWISISTSFVSSKSSEESIVEVAIQSRGWNGWPRWRKNGVQLKRELTSSWTTKRRNSIENLGDSKNCHRLWTRERVEGQGPSSHSLTWEEKNSQWTIVINFFSEKHKLPVNVMEEQLEDVGRRSPMRRCEVEESWRRTDMCCVWHCFYTLKKEKWTFMNFAAEDEKGI